jgi:hypothetical protein
MTIYEIDREILNLMDPETGEIADYDLFAQLQMDRETKIENVALWRKNLAAEAKAIREEEKVLAERRKACEAKQERLEAYLNYALAGEKFSTPRVSISYRKSVAVNVDMEQLLRDPDAERYLVYDDPKPDKNAIKDVLKNGGTIAGCTLDEHMNMTIK